MPTEQGYERQVAPRGPVAQPLATAEQYGAGLGRGLQDLGGALGRAEENARRATDDQEWAQFVSNRARRKTDLNTKVNKLRAEYAPGHAGRVREIDAAGRDEQTAGFTSDALRRRAQAEIEADSAALIQGEDDFETVKLVAVSGQNLKDAKASILARLQMATTPAEIDKLYVDGHGEWGVATGEIALIDEPTRARANREFAADALEIAATRKADLGDPAGALVMLADGAVRVGMAPEAIERVQATIGFAVRREAIAVKEAAAAQDRAGKEAQEAARDEIKSLKVMIDNGDDPGNARIAAVAAAATAAGLPESELLAAGYLVEGAARAKAAEGMQTPALRQRVRALEVAEGAGRLDAEGRRELKDYGPMLDARDKRAGAQIAALDQGEAITTLRAIPRSERVAVAGQGGVAARRVVLADLDDASIGTITIGAAKRVANKAAYMPVLEGKTEGDPAAAEQFFRNALGQRLTNALGEGYGPMLNATLDLYVGSQVKAGDAGTWDLREFKKAVRIVFGATRRRPNAEGIAVYQGGVDGVRGRMVFLPDRMTADELDRSLSRLDFGARGAIYGDGSPARTADVMANHRIVLDHQDDDGKVWYRFENARGSALRRKGGGLFLEGFAS